MKVSEIISNPVETISSDSTVAQAAEMMESFDVGILPVEKGSDIVGVITDRDIVLRVIAKRLDPENTPVSKVMTTEPISCSEDTDMRQAAKMMQEKQVYRLLVVDSDGEICGILSIRGIALKMKDEHLLWEVLERICEPAQVH